MRAGPGRNFLNAGRAGPRNNVTQPPLICISTRSIHVHVLVILYDYTSIVHSDAYHLIIRCICIQYTVHVQCTDTSIYCSAGMASRSLDSGQEFGHKYICILYGQVNIEIEIETKLI